MLNDLINDLTGWIPFTWLEHTVEILIYLGLMMALAAIPLVLWLMYAAATTGRRTQRT